MAIDKINIKQYKLFENTEAVLSSGVNVFIGENATGKTLLLNGIYDYYKTFSRIPNTSFNNYSSYLPSNSSNFLAPNFNDIHNHFANLDKHLIPRDDISNVLTGMSFRSRDIVIDGSGGLVTYIPVKDMLTHSKGLIAMSQKYDDFPFSEELIEIVQLSTQWKVKDVPAIAKNIAPKLENMMEGKVLYEHDEFFILKQNGTKISFDEEAEGYKKIGLLWQLLMNENIIPGSILLWDEPDSNLNPKYIPDIVEILLELARNDVQVIVTTHSYIFAKYFEVRRKEKDNVLFHSLYKSGDLGVRCESNKNFKELKHNALVKVFDELLNEVYDLNLGE